MAARADRGALEVPMPETRPLQRLAELGQSIWIDYLSRELLANGELARLISEDAVVGVTSNPTIFENAIAHGDAYDEQLRELLPRELSAKEIFLELACADVAGRNMAGEQVAYTHLPFFYSDLFDLGYEAVGELGSQMDTLVELGELGDEGIVSYLDRERRPRGVLLWNLFGRLDDARALIRGGEPVRLGALSERVG